jgi:hypothetical protein
MQTDVTITDPDRKLDFTLALEFTYRGPTRRRFGWNDGGEPGESAAIEIDRVRCLEIVVWCGQRGVSAVPGLAVEDRLESHLGAWCLAHYPDEIERAIWEQLQTRDERVLC